MTTIRIKGMSCHHCVASVTKALEELPGVTDVRVDLEGGTAGYRGNIAAEQAVEAIKKVGFEAEAP